VEFLKFIDWLFLTWQGQVAFWVMFFVMRGAMKD